MVYKDKRRSHYHRGCTLIVYCCIIFLYGVSLILVAFYQEIILTLQVPMNTVRACRYEYIPRYSVTRKIP